MVVGTKSVVSRVLVLKLVISFTMVVGTSLVEIFVVGTMMSLVLVILRVVVVGTTTVVVSVSARNLVSLFFFLRYQNFEKKKLKTELTRQCRGIGCCKCRG